MRVLITSARAPVALEWAQIALAGNHEVVLIDTLNNPLSRSLRGTTYRKVPSPRFHFEQYKKHIIELIAQCDFVIPTCEDIFYLTSATESQPELQKKVFAPSFQTLQVLHNKQLVQELLNDVVLFPETKLITDKSQIDINNNETILKPVFSRFGSQIVTNISKENIVDVSCSESEPWIQQERIEGEYLCSYAVIYHGTVVNHVVYKPKYLVNNAAATYFEYTEDRDCNEFIAAFAEEHSYHGQVAFDFIKNDKGLYVIECNPRATSGLHLIAQKVSVTESGIASNEDGSMLESCRVGSSLLFMFGFKTLFTGTLRTLLLDYRKATDVLSRISLLKQLVSFKELFMSARKEKITLAEASAFDIEYNG